MHELGGQAHGLGLAGGVLDAGDFQLAVPDHLQSGIENAVSEELLIGVRPQDVEVLRDSTGRPDCIAAQVYTTEPQGDITILDLTIGDRLVKAVVGIATALNDAYPDPADETGKAAVVDVAPVKKLQRPVTLAEIKVDPAFKTFPLVRISRLSVMPVTDAEWKRIEQIARR